MNDIFLKNVISMRGDTGQKWLNKIPQLLEKYSSLWELEIFPPFTLSYNYVAPVKRKDGSSAVIKIGYPEDREFIEGIEALKIYNGQACVRLLDESREDMVILLEKAEPGETLLTVEDEDQKITIAAGVMKQLWQNSKPSHGLSSLSEWGGAFKRLRQKYRGRTGPLPEELVTKAESLFEKYTKSGEEVVLHGDLHFENILLSHRGWIAIDPKGIVGDKAYEAAALLRNPAYLADNPLASNILDHRIRLLSQELKIDENRIRGWGVTQAVLSALWSLEDHGQGWEKGIRFANLLDK